MWKQRLKGRIALITGASRGIGRAVAKRFAKEGAHLILVATTVGGLEEVDDEIIQLTGTSSTLVPLDVTDFSGVSQLCQQISKRHKRLDILVGNAGILGNLGPITHTLPKIWGNVININLHANWHFLHNFDPLLEKSEAGRVIFVTSTLGSVPRAYWGAYAVSKAALEMMTKIYALEKTQTKIKANLFDPGPIQTSMRAQAMPGEDPRKLKLPENVTEYFVKLAEVSCKLNGKVIKQIKS